MKSTIVGEDGSVRCPECGAADSFTAQRTKKAKSTFGLASLIAAPKLRCNGCGTYLTPGATLSDKLTAKKDREKIRQNTAKIRQNREEIRDLRALRREKGQLSKAEFQAGLAAIVGRTSPTGQSLEGASPVVAAAAAAAGSTGLVDDGAAAAEPAVLGQIRQLAELRDQGILTEAEFASKKAELLARL
jgi:uncharacterized Zn finger protein (UPF0148 family)